MQKVIDNLAGMPPDGRNAALNGAAWTLGRRITAGALEQADVEDELYAAAEHNGLVVDDGDRQCWATIRSGLSAGLQQPNNLDADSGQSGGLVLGSDDPRRVGGRYRCGYWGQEYEVMAFHDFPDWRGRSIAVRWLVHPPPRVHVHTAMHATAWEWDKDRILFEPSSGK